MMEGIMKIIHCGIGTSTTEERTVQLPEPAPAPAPEAGAEDVLNTLLGTK